MKFKIQFLGRISHVSGASATTAYRTVRTWRLLIAVKVLLGSGAWKNVCDLIKQWAGRRSGIRCSFMSSSCGEKGCGWTCRKAVCFSRSMGSGWVSGSAGPFSGRVFLLWAAGNRIGSFGPSQGVERFKEAQWSSREAMFLPPLQLQFS